MGVDIAGFPLTLALSRQGRGESLGYFLSNQIELHLEKQVQDQVFGGTSGVAGFFGNLRFAEGTRNDERGAES